MSAPGPEHVASVVQRAEDARWEARCACGWYSVTWGSLAARWDAQEHESPSGPKEAPVEKMRWAHLAHLPARDAAGGRLALPHLPAAPLLEQIRLRGGPRGVGVEPRSAEEQALVRAKRDGWVTEVAADKLAIGLLHMHPGEVWGWELLTG